MTLSSSSRLLNQRFARNFLPIPATNNLAFGKPTPDFELADITNDRLLKLSDYWGEQPVILAFTRIFTEKHYCPLCYPHIKEMNANADRFRDRGAAVLMITSTDPHQTQQVVQDLEMNMPLLSNPRCDVFRGYGTGQSLGAPLPAQFVLDRQGNLRFKHLFSFLSNNAPVDKLLAVLDRLD